MRHHWHVQSEGIGRCPRKTTQGDDNQGLLPVDATIESLAPLLEPVDIIINGGNSHFPDSARRLNKLAK